MTQSRAASADIVDRLLDAALPDVPFEGWSERLVLNAAKSLGIDSALALDALPGGPLDLVERLARRLDAAMAAAIPEDELKALKIRARITRLVRARLDAELPYREAARRAASLGALPHNAPRMLAILYRTVDAIWRLAGDRATDFNHYTKRVTLGAVYAATFAVWLQDDSPGEVRTSAFLDRRIADVMRIEGVKGAAARMAARLPSPVAVLARLRYGRPGN